MAMVIMEGKVAKVGKVTSELVDIWVRDYMGSGLGLAQASVLDSAVLKQELTLEQASWVQDYMGSGPESALEQALWVRDYMGSGLESVQALVLDSPVLRHLEMACMQALVDMWEQGSEAVGV